MACVKTAISMERPLFEKTDRLARRLKVSRSELVARALRAYIHRVEGREMLEQLNASYADGPDEEDRAVTEHIRQLHERCQRDPW